MWRVYFIIGDFLACTVTGAGAAWFTAMAVPADWFVALGMLAGMVIGVFAGLICGLLASPLFGAMEVMLPVSLSAMVAGMGVGMAQTVAPGIDGISSATSVLGGVLAGLACLAYTYLLQAMLSGEQKIPEVK